MLFSAKHACLLAFSMGSLIGVHAHNYTSLAGILEDIPSCAQACFVTGITSIRCSVTSIQKLTDCACTDVPMQARLNACIQNACPYYPDQIAADTVGLELCAPYPKQTRQTAVTVTGAVAVALPVPFFILRCYAKYLQTGRLWLDDYVALIAQFAILVLGGGAIASAPLGFGMHYWTVPLINAEALYTIYYVTQLFYILVQVFAKLAILILFKRIFPSRWFQWASKIMITLLIGHGVAYFFVIVAQCQPIERAWDKYIEDYKCVDLSKVVFSGAIFSIVEDVVILAMPLPELYKLKVDGRKRVGLAVLLGIGSLACITSAIRIKYITQFRLTIDQPWDQVDIVIWSLIECIVAVICGSILTYRPLFGSLMATIRTTAHSLSAPSKSSRRDSRFRELRDAENPQPGDSNGTKGTNSTLKHVDSPMQGSKSITSSQSGSRTSKRISHWAGFNRTPRLPQTINTNLDNADSGDKKKAPKSSGWQELSLLDPDWSPVVVGMSPVENNRNTWNPNSDSREAVHRLDGSAREIPRDRPMSM